MSKTGAREKLKSPKDIFNEKFYKFLAEIGFHSDAMKDIPTKWERIGDLVILPPNSFRDPLWQKLGTKLWEAVAMSLKAERVARREKIYGDLFKTSTLQVLVGSDGWVSRVENRITFAYDVTKRMYNTMNTLEQLRISKFSCDDEVIVDMYAGLGYFTLPFLVHTKAAMVFACDWDPNAIEALEMNLAVNDVKERCVVLYGDNKKVCPKKIADRVYLGLIPSSEPHWEIACHALKPSTGGMVHVHGTVCMKIDRPSSAEKNGLLKKYQHLEEECVSWAQGVVQMFLHLFQVIHDAEWNVEIMDIFKVKSLGSHIQHMVVDLKCTPGSGG